tara:strand:+ start:3062 stop:3649 length:588 start_codon:yes stop_codon:yes gene_type:complete
MNQLRNISKNLIFAFGLSLFLQIVLGNYIVDGDSMSPTLKNNQRVFVNKFIYFKLPYETQINKNFIDNFKLNPTNGDIVIFDPPFPYDSTGKRFVKRVIGKPGDSLENKNGTILVNNVPFANKFGSTAEFSEIEKMIIPEGYYYLLGDNRNKSNDSRSFGLIPRSSIKGRIWIIYWPFTNLKVFDYNLISTLNES